ncbi:hypothetical protein GDO81_027799 [Engystomops pustulosus]|uniref:Taste receptor type 2 n=1 Tax=Engystomops pustulosus TaxID=76066 RepID=A0AAV6ZLY7_ENGPU|nr:hypothetical protein GDO81_027799 [Engystomops pustulosus]
MDVLIRSPTFIIGLSIISLELFASIVLSFFILVVILCDWQKTRHVRSRDRIQVALNSSAVLFTIVSTFNSFPDILQTKFLQNWSSKNLVNVFSVYSMCSCSWLTALLCFFYFIKVVNVQRGFLVWVKMKIASIVPWQIFAVELVSLVTSSLSLLLYRPPQVLHRNESIIEQSHQSLEIRALVADGIFLLICLPFVLSFITTIITVGFLMLHIQKMKDTMTLGDINLNMYRRVIHKMLHFLVLYSVFYLSMFFYHSEVFAPYSLGYWIDLFLIFLFSPAQAFLHILDNPKLRSSWRRKLRPQQKFIQQ